MLSLLFHKPGTALNHEVGPAPWFRITGTSIYQGPAATQIATLQNHMWEAAGFYFSSYDITGPATVQFDSPVKNSQVFGPFEKLKTLDGVMWASDVMFARFTSETHHWFHYGSNSFWPAMTIKPPR